MDKILFIIALRKPKTVYNFGLSECNKVKVYINDDWVDLDLFYGKVKIGPSGFFMEKAEKVHVSAAIMLFWKYM